ncbi:hypothetical protein CSAG_04784 [Citrobacter portucalensis]|nr:hypothetical protein CSAG_04784 [Citrobacter portucalensis]
MIEEFKYRSPESFLSTVLPFMNMKKTRLLFLMTIIVLIVIRNFLF